jgi:hypothetical protein
VHLKHHPPAILLHRDFFSPLSTIERTYEISRGRKLDAGRFTFPLAQFEVKPEHRAHAAAFLEDRRDWQGRHVPGYTALADCTFCRSPQIGVTYS